MDHWHALPKGPFFRSARLDCALARLSGAMLCETERGRLLALPYEEAVSAAGAVLPGAYRGGGAAPVRHLPARPEKFTDILRKMKIMSTIS